MVAELPARHRVADPRAGSRSAAPASSVYVPVFPSEPSRRPSSRAAATWARFAALRDRVEADPDALAAARSVLATVEAELWDSADDAYATGSRARLERVVASSWAPVDAALASLGV